MSLDNKQIKDGLGDVFTTRMKDISSAGDGTLMRTLLSATLVPNDYGNGGMYTNVAQSGSMAAGIAGPASVYTFRNPSSNFAVVKRVGLIAWSDTVAFAGALGFFSLMVLRNFTVMDTGGGSIDFSGNNAKLRTSMNSALAQIMVSTTAALTVGTRIADPSPMGRIVVTMPQTTQTMFVNNGTYLLNKMNGEHPLVLATQEGFTIRATIPPVGTWVFNVTTEWEELPLY
jgi:hypothetical protein